MNPTVKLGPPPSPNRKDFPFIGTVDYPGLPLINIENKKGTARSGVDPDGNPWSVVLPAHYGEFDGTLGVDGDPIDVYVGDNRHAPFAYLIPVASIEDGSYDEDKLFVGFDNLDEVCAAFRTAYNKPGFRFDVTRRFSIPELADWLATHGDEGKRIEAGREMHKGASPGLYVHGHDGKVSSLSDWVHGRDTADVPEPADLRFVTEEEVRAAGRKAMASMRPFTYAEIEGRAPWPGEAQEADEDGSAPPADLDDFDLDAFARHKADLADDEALKAIYWPGDDFDLEAFEAFKAQLGMFGVGADLQTVSKTDKNGRTERRHVKPQGGRDPNDRKTVDLEDLIRARTGAPTPPQAKPPTRAPAAPARQAAPAKAPQAPTAPAQRQPAPHPDPMVRQIQAEEASRRSGPQQAPKGDPMAAPAPVGQGADPHDDATIPMNLPTPSGPPRMSGKEKFESMISMLTRPPGRPSLQQRKPRTFGMHSHLGGHP